MATHPARQALPTAAAIVAMALNNEFASAISVVLQWWVTQSSGAARKRPKRLTQILEQRVRQPEICGFESFREAVVDEGERMPGLIALAVFGEQACQGHR